MKAINTLGITILFIALTYFGYVKVNRFFAIDSCLDKGGRWNYSLKICECSDSSRMDKSDLTKLDTSRHLIIRDKCAVIFNPDSNKISESKKIDEYGFYTSADDAMYYLSQSRDFLKSKRIQIVETDSQIIDFMVDDKLIKSIDLRENDKFWGIILFDGKDKPVEIDMTVTKLEFEKYIK